MENSLPEGVIKVNSLADILGLIMLESLVDKVKLSLDSCR
jgi:hypothetical protein